MNAEEEVLHIQKKLMKMSSGDGTVLMNYFKYFDRQNCTHKIKKYFLGSRASIRIIKSLTKTTSKFRITSKNKDWNDCKCAPKIK